MYEDDLVLELGTEEALALEDAEGGLTEYTVELQ